MKHTESIQAVLVLTVFAIGFMWGRYLNVHPLEDGMHILQAPTPQPTPMVKCERDMLSISVGDDKKQVDKTSVDKDHYYGHYVDSVAIQNKLFKDIPRLVKSDADSILLQLSHPSAKSTFSSSISNISSFGNTSSFSVVDQNCDEVQLVLIPTSKAYITEPGYKSTKRCVILTPSTRTEVPSFILRYTKRFKSNNKLTYTPYLWRESEALTGNSHKPPKSNHRDNHIKRLSSFFPAIREILFKLEKALRGAYRGTSQEKAKKPREKPKEAEGQGEEEEPQRPKEPREPIIVMTINAGMLDLWMNFVCSARQIGANLGRLIVFTASPALATTIKALAPEVATFSHPGFGAFAAKEAEFYGDSTFMQMMWLKAVAPYLVSSLGFDVLFQDADVVWLRDVVGYFQGLRSMEETDAYWSNDGAVSPRFQPYFANSGFYYMKHSDLTVHFLYRALFEYDYMLMGGSHQIALARMQEYFLYRYGMRNKVLPMEKFPSGKMYHHDKPFMAQMRRGSRHPYIFHMNWTLNKREKLAYMKEVGIWFLQGGADCSSSTVGDTEGGGDVERWCQCTAPVEEER